MFIIAGASANAARQIGMTQSQDSPSADYAQGGQSAGCLPWRVRLSHPALHALDGPA